MYSNPKATNFLSRRASGVYQLKTLTLILFCTRTISTNFEINTKELTYILNKKAIEELDSSLWILIF